MADVISATKRAAAQISAPSTSSSSMWRVLTHGAQTKVDVQAWSGKVGHEYLGHLSADGYERVFIRRTK